MAQNLTRSDREHLATLDATAQASLVRAGELTRSELVEAAIARIEQLNPTLNAVVTTVFEQALAGAEAAPADAPFCGVPFLLKDLAMEAEGIRFCEGSRFLSGHVSTVDSESVVRMRAAGLVMLGKTNTCEFGLKPTAEPLLFGATANPWDTGRTPGGSSGGSAAAVASGMVPMAHGNDSGGSIRIPASCCGLFGLKPTRARNTFAPLYGDAFGGWAVEHALTRSVRDSAALLDVTRGPAPGDPYAVPPPERPYVDEVGRPPGRLRVAYTTRTADGRPPHPECRRALEDTVALCESLGHHVLERDLTELTPDVGERIGMVYDAAAVWIVRYWSRIVGRAPERDELEPFTWALYERGLAATGGDYLLAVTDLQSFARRVAAAFQGFDVWMSPTLAQLPPPLGSMTETPEEPFRGNDVAGELVAFPLVVANITGNPAMSVPAHWAEDGLPVGVNVMAAFGDEGTLFRLAAQLEEARPWAHRRPPVWAGA